MHHAIYFKLPWPRFTIILKVKDCLNFKEQNFTVRKTIFKSYSESQFLRDPAESVHGVLIRKKYSVDFVLVCFYSHMNFLP